uniref:Uncharacterized protein n=1 Tax=Anguilla anguilla TaxID=7936 RepID=A0A0E9RA90_ANGAN
MSEPKTTERRKGGAYRGLSSNSATHISAHVCIC